MGNNVSSDWQVYLDKAIADWSQSSRLNLKKVGGSTHPSRCSLILGRIEVCYGNYGATEWDGLAWTLAIPGGHILAGGATMNESSLPSSLTARRQMVMCQEIGHALGLDHQDENKGNPNLGTCMDWTSVAEGGGYWGPPNTGPNWKDFDLLAHVDGVVNVDRHVIMNAIQFVRIPFHKKGVPMRSSRDGGIRVYQLDLGRGLTLKTVTVRVR